jgi:hypothetical protein
MSALTNFEQDVVKIATKIKNGVETAATDAAKVLGWITNEAPTIAGLASLTGPSGASIAALGLKLIGLVGTAIEGSGTAAGANAVNVTFDEAVINDVKAIIAAVKAI